jgi:hypothetical protein
VAKKRMSEAKKRVGVAEKRLGLSLLEIDGCSYEEEG